MRTMTRAILAGLSLVLVSAAPAVPWIGGYSANAADPDPHHPTATLPAPETVVPRPTEPSTNQPSMPMEMMTKMMAGMDMMAMMGRSAAADPLSGLPLDRIDGRLAFIKAELGITPAQLPQWKTAETAVRATVTKLLTEARTITQAPTTALEKLDRVGRINALLGEAIAACRDAFAPLYATLTDGQKQTADELMLPAMGLAQFNLAM